MATSPDYSPVCSPDYLGPPATSLDSLGPIPIGLGAAADLFCAANAAEGAPPRTVEWYQMILIRAVRRFGEARPVDAIPAAELRAWAALFEDAGYVALKPGWPDDPETVAEAHANPKAFAGKSVGQVADHIDAIVRKLNRKPVIIGHSFGGLLAQILAGRGLAAATVAIDPAPFRGGAPSPDLVAPVRLPGARESGQLPPCGALEL